MMKRIADCIDCGGPIWDGIPHYDTPKGKCHRECFKSTRLLGMFEFPQYYTDEGDSK